MAIVTGTSEDEILIGTVFADLINGEAGDDQLLGLAGNDANWKKGVTDSVN